MVGQAYSKPTSPQLRRCESFLVTATATALGISPEDLQVRVRSIAIDRLLANLYVKAPSGWRPMLPYHVEASTVYECLMLLTFNIAATRVGVKTCGWNSFDPPRELTPSTRWI